MKHIRKMLSVFAALLMVVGLSLVSLKAEGTCTITIENPVKNSTYTAYKLLDASKDGEAITYYTSDAAYATTLTAAVAPGTTTKLFDVVGPDKENKYNVSKADSATDAQITDWFKTNKPSSATAITPTSTSDDTVVFGKLDAGYYLIDTGTNRAYSIGTTTDTDAKIVDKNASNPTIPDDFKTVSDIQNGNTTTSTLNAQIGDTVYFKIGFTATNYVQSEGNSNPTLITEYTIEDAASGMTINDDLVIKVGNSAITAFTKTSTENGGFSIVIPWVSKDATGTYTTNSLYADPSAVEITYSAVITETNNATSGLSSNSAKIKYLSTEKTDDANVYTAKLNITKVDFDNQDKKLTGAEFKLYSDAYGTDVIELVAETDGYRLAKTDETGVDTFAVKDDGTVTIRGLDADKLYYVQEVKAPAGYKLDNTIYTIGGTETGAVSFVARTATDSAHADKTITNKAGQSLPSTGGMGTTLFYVAGGLLVAGAAIVLVTKKRINA